MKETNKKKIFFMFINIIIFKIQNTEVKFFIKFLKNFVNFLSFREHNRLLNNCKIDTDISLKKIF